MSQPNAMLAKFLSAAPLTAFKFVEVMDAAALLTKTSDLSLAMNRRSPQAVRADPSAAEVKLSVRQIYLACQVLAFVTHELSARLDGRAWIASDSVNIRQGWRSCMIRCVMDEG